MHLEHDKLLLICENQTSGITYCTMRWLCAHIYPVLVWNHITDFGFSVFKDSASYGKEKSKWHLLWICCKIILSGSFNLVNERPEISSSYMITWPSFVKSLNVALLAKYISEGSVRSRHQVTDIDLLEEIMDLKIFVSKRWSKIFVKF